MITMQRISDQVPRTAPLLRVYRNYCTLNAAAMRLLGVGGGRKRYAEITVSEEPDRQAWICGTDNVADYRITNKSKRTGRICSVELSCRLCELLGGYGTYQISATRQYYDVNKDKFYYAIQNK